MEFYTTVNKRRTIRDFLDKEIPIEIIQKLVNAGLKAPTNDHLRNWEFVVITDKEDKAKLISTIPKQYSTKMVEDFMDQYHMTDPIQREMYMDGIPKQYSMLYRSGCLILPLFRQDYPLLNPDSINALNGFASIWCCIENILLAATAEGLGCVTRIPFPEESEYLKKAIGHPDNYMMPCYISVGYPAEDAVHNVQHEYAAEDKIHINHW
jgi:nitroreductase